MRRDGDAARLMWLTCAVDGTDHAVSDAAFVAAQGGDGRYVSRCGATVWASSIAAPPARRCPACAAAAGELPSRSADRRTARLWQRLVQRDSA